MNNISSTHEFFSQLENWYCQPLVLRESNSNIFTIQLHIRINESDNSDYLQINQLIKDILHYCKFSPNYPINLFLKNQAINIFGTIDYSFNNELLEDVVKNLNNIFVLKNNYLLQPKLLKIQINHDCDKNHHPHITQSEHLLEVDLYDEFVIITGRNLSNKYLSQGIK